MPTCSRCSSTITPDARFCPRCGAPSDLAENASEAQTVVPDRPPSRPASDPSSLGHGRFEPGTRLGTRYRVVGLLGRGGMGEVYRADDLELGQSVALKFLPVRFARDPEALARLRAEVRLSRQVAHPNVARVYDIAEADGHVFLTMEYVDGEDLASVLRRMGRPSRDKAVEIARQLCLGLAAAHERGVLHRDLKPANVMIDGRGRVRVMDFGLAALEGDARDDEHVVGTPAYMAPEQLAGGTVTAQSDVFALGLVLFELFTGRRVHETTDRAELARRHAAGSIPTPSSMVDDMDPVVERVVLRCLETDPRLRPASAYAVLGALPGGDPLAAALAAGETPSPELVAHAGEAGGLAPWLAGTLFAGTLAAIVVSTWLSTPHFRDLRLPPGELAYKAAAALEALGYDHLPRHTAAGYAARLDLLERLTKRHWPADSLANAGPGAEFYWRRWAPEQLVPRSIHSSVVRLADPNLSGRGSVAVLIDMRGRLVGLQAIANADSAGGAAMGAPWPALFALAGLDSARLVPEARTWAPPVPSDTTGSWALATPRGTLHVRAAAHRGRAVWFAIRDSLGSATAGVQGGAGGGWEIADWVNFALWLAMCIGGIVLARRNLKLGRGDRRGAFRLAAFVFVATALETVFTWNVPEDGIGPLVDSILGQRALGHAMIHASQMWLAYVAIEPYVRRLWPRMLVSWARLASGRARDPMVGRDVLAGFLLGAAGTVLLQVGQIVTQHLHLPTAIDVQDYTDLAALASLGGLGYQVAFFCSVTVLNVLETLVVCLLVHLVTRNDRGTFLLAGALATVWAAVPLMTPALPLPVLESVIPTVVMFVALFRYGLLTALAATLAGNLLLIAPPAFAPGAWYDGRGTIVLALLGALLAYAAWTALAGQPLMGDLLEDRKAPRA